MSRRSRPRRSSKATRHKSPKNPDHQAADNEPGESETPVPPKAANNVTHTGVESDAAEEARRLLVQVVDILNRAFPQKGSKWYERVYERIQFVAKYIGIPALLIAAIIPVYEFGKGTSEYRNKRHVASVYREYASILISEGETERAQDVLDGVSHAESIDVETSYTQAKLLAMQAIKQGKNHTRAEDTLTVLLRVHQSRPLMFPRLGGDRDVFALELGLIDIFIATQRYELALKSISELRAKTLQKDFADKVTAAQLDLREGTVAVLEHRFDDAQEPLKLALESLQNQKRDDLEVECLFQLGKSSQFNNDDKQALELYGKALHRFELQKDKYGQLRTHNNIAMIHLGNGEIDKAAFHYRQQERLARAVRDDLGLSRSLLNLGIVANRQGRSDEAIRNYLEALESYRETENRLGEAAALQNLAVVYEGKPNLSKAIHYAKTALVVFISLKDLRGIGSAAGTIADVAFDIGDYRECVYHNLLSMLVRRHINEVDKFQDNVQVMHRVRDQIGVEKLRELLQEVRVSLMESMPLLAEYDIAVVIPKEIVLSTNESDNAR